LGVDGTGKSMAYWQSLQRFWGDCLQHSGAVLARFTVLRYVRLVSTSNIAAPGG
jgi:hypothetical protein